MRRVPVWMSCMLRSIAGSSMNQAMNVTIGRQTSVGRGPGGVSMNELVERVNKLLMAGEPGNITKADTNGYVGYEPQAIIDSMNEGFGDDARFPGHQQFVHAL